MFGGLALVLLVPVLVAVGATTLLRASAAAPLEGAARRARRRSVAATVTTGLAGLAALVLWPVSGSVVDLRIATLPAVAALVVVLTSAVAELTWPRPSGDRRVASLGARQGRSPAGLLRLFWIGAATTAGLLAAGALTAAPDGRSLERAWAAGGAGHGPYPGLHYTAPVALAATMLALAALWALRRVELRPSLGPDLLPVDRAVRRASQVRVLRGAAAGMLLTAAGLGFTMGTAIVWVSRTARANDIGATGPGYALMQAGGIALLALAAASVVAAIVAACWPAPRIEAREAPAGALSGAEVP